MMPGGVPQNWFEWWASVFDPDVYMLQKQAFGVTITVAANISGATNNIQVPEPMYVFGVESQAIQSLNGQIALLPYRIGFKASNGNDWYSGQWMSGTVTGDLHANGTVAAGLTSAGRIQKPTWDWPRELAQNDIITVTIDNNINALATALIVDAMLTGYVVRRRTAPISRSK